jgi:hypothetical protein
MGFIKTLICKLTITQEVDIPIEVQRNNAYYIAYKKSMQLGFFNTLVSVLFIIASLIILWIVIKMVF